MKRMRRRILVGFVCLLIPPAAIAQTPGYRITGVVVDSNSNNPVAHCHLEASINGGRRLGGSFVRPGAGGPGGPGGFGPRRGQAFGNSSTLSTDADEKGRFVLSLPSAGAWDLTASSPGYVTQSFAAHGAYSSAVVLTEKTPAYDLRFQLPPEGRITGTVLDEAGEAVRNASVSLYLKPLVDPSDVESTFQARSFAQTDDRGAYEFDALAPGSYRVLVNARPWYASTSQHSSTTPGTADPSLDVSYSPSWYPGVSDQTQAEAIQLAPGDARTADFQLATIPSLHLIIIPPQMTPSLPGRPSVPVFPIIESVDSAGRMGQAQVSTRRADGSIDVGGLSPGTYRVTLQGQQQGSSVVQINPGTVRTVDLRQADAEMARITFHFDGDEDGEGQSMVQLIDPSNGRRYSPNGRTMGGRGSQGGLGGGPMRQGESNLEMQIPPGRYKVFLQGRRGTYLTSVSAQGAEVEGRLVNVRAGDVTLTLHTAEGRATVTGIATKDGKPSLAAAVLLVPAGLGDAHALTMVARDQTNTDGSFELPSVIPGQYILIAVDHGWQVNWDDPTTLRGYLIHGIPLDLSGETKIHQDIVTQSP